MSDEKIVYSTTNLKLAATLNALGHDVLGINTSMPTSAIFIFPQSQRLDDTIMQYWQDKLLVEPKLLFNTRDNLLNQVKESVQNKQSYGTTN